MFLSSGGVSEGEQLSQVTFGDLPRPRFELCILAILMHGQGLADLLLLRLLTKDNIDLNSSQVSKSCWFAIIIS